MREGELFGNCGANELAAGRKADIYTQLQSEDTSVHVQLSYLYSLLEVLKGLYFSGR